MFQYLVDRAQENSLPLGKSKDVSVNQLCYTLSTKLSLTWKKSMLFLKNHNFILKL